MSRVKLLPFGLFLPDRSIFEPGTVHKADNMVRLHGQWRCVEAERRFDSVTLAAGDLSEILKAHCHIFDIDSKQRLIPSSEVTSTDFNYTYTAIDEDSFDDDDFIYSESDPTNAIYRTKLSLVQDPPNSDHVVYFRYRIWNLDAGEAYSLVVTLKDDGGTTIATATVSGTGEVGWTLDSISLSAGEIAAIVLADYETDGLDIEFDATTDAGGNQTLEPAGDTNIGGWEDELGGLVSLYTKLIDSDDTTWAISKPLEVGEEDSYTIAFSAGEGFLKFVPSATTIKIYATNDGMFASITPILSTGGKEIEGSSVDAISPVTTTPTAIGVSDLNRLRTSIAAAAVGEGVKLEDLSSALVKLKVTGQYPTETASAVWANDYPGADVEVNTWTPQTGPELWKDLDTEDDVDWISHESDDENPNFTVDMADAFDLDAQNPNDLNSEGQIVIRLKGDGSGARSVKLEVFEEGVAVATKTIGTTVDGTWQTKSWDIGEGNEPTITDFEELRLKVTVIRAATDTWQLDVSFVKLRLAAARRLAITEADFVIEPKNRIAISWAQMTVPEEATGPQTGDFDKPIFAVGMTKHLYEFQLPPGPGFTKRNKGGADYSEGPRGWDFTSYGQSIIATNYVDAVQVMDVQNDTAYSDLITSSSKPKARFVDVFGNQVALGDINFTGHYSDSVWLMAINDATDADDASSINQRTYPIPGQIMGLAGGKWGGLVFKRNGILVWSYIGGTAYWRQDILTESVGTGFPNSIIKAGDAVYFAGQGPGSGVGFYRVLGGTRLDRIDGGVRRKFFDSRYEDDAFGPLASSDPRILENAIVGSACTSTGLIFWLYRMSTDEAYENQRIAVFNPEDESFSILKPTDDTYTAMAALLNVEGDWTHTLSGVVLFGQEEVSVSSQDTSQLFAAGFVDRGILPGDLEGHWEQLDKKGDAAYRVVGARPVMRFAERVSDTAPSTWKTKDVTLELSMSDDPLRESLTVTESVTGEKANKDGYLPFNLRGRFVKAKISVGAFFLGSVREVVGVQIVVDRVEGL